MFPIFTIRIIGKNYKHSFRSIMGFALIISMIIATSGVISGFSARLLGITEKAGESSSIFIQPRGSTEGLPSELLEFLNNPNIKQVLPIAERMVHFSSMNSTFNTYLVGVNISELISYYPRGELSVGRLPRSNNNFSECLIGQELQNHVNSSEINLTDSSLQNTQLKVVGLLQNVKEFDNTILVDITEYNRIFNQTLLEKLYQKIKIRLKNGYFMDETISELRSLLKDYLHILIIKPEQQADVFTFSLFSDIITRLNLLFGVLFIIALIRLFHTISWFVKKYERDLLIMRSMGMSSFQMISLVLLLSGIIGNVGLFVGLILGFLIPSLIVAILTLFFSERFHIPNFAGSTLISLIILSNVIILIAALYPAINITLKKPGTISILTEAINR